MVLVCARRHGVQDDTERVKLGKSGRKLWPETCWDGSSWATVASLALLVLSLEIPGSDIFGWDKARFFLQALESATLSFSEGR